MSLWNDCVYWNSAKPENQSMEVFSEQLGYGFKLAPETNYQDLWWDAWTWWNWEQETQEFCNKQLCACKCRKSLLRLIRLQSSFWVCICRTSFQIRQIYYQNQGIAEGKHDTLRLMDSKRPFKKMEEWIVGVHFKSPSKKINIKSFIFCYISCVKVVIFLTNSVNLLVTEKWNVTVMDCLLLDVQVLDFWEY